MAQGGRIDYTIGFNVDKAGLNDLKQSLQNLGNLTPTQLFNMNPGVFKDIRSDAQKNLLSIKSTLKEVETAFDNAFNATTGLMNLQKLNVSLKQIGIDNIYNKFSMLGQKGQEAFYKVTKSALTTEMQFKKTNGLLDKMGQTLLNTAKWQISSSLINRFTGSIQQAYGYVQHLDSSLNDIRIVTGKSADEMERFAVQANKTAQALGKTTTDATEAALIYYQQGLSDEETQARMETTLKAANVTGQSTAAVSEELTAVWNGYKVSTEETEASVDKLAAVAATTASDLQELSTGMSKVASAANAMGVDMDQLNAQIATIISVTRQAPESVGTALKTIYARLADLKLGDTDEDGLGLGDVSGTLDKVGIAVLDANGDLREMGDVIEDVAAKWDTWTSAQQTAIAEVMAGKRQYNNLVALFENWNMYSSALDTSRNSLGTLQNQQDIYMESTEAHINQLKAEWEDLYDSLLDSKTINNVVDSLTKVISLFSNFTDAIGGGNNLFLMLGSTAMRVFDKQLGQGLTNFITNLSKAKENVKELHAQLDTIKAFEKSEGYQNIPMVRALVDAQKQVSQYYDILSNEQINTANALASQVGDAKLLEEQWNRDVDALEEYIHLQEEVNIGNGKKVNVDKYSFRSDQPHANQNFAVVKTFEQSQSIINSFTEKIKEANKAYVELNKNIVDNKDTEKQLNRLTNAGQTLETQFALLNKQGLFKNVDSNKIIDLQKNLHKLGSAISETEAMAALDALKVSLNSLPKEAQQALNKLKGIFEGGNIDWSAPARNLSEFLKTAELQQFTTNVVNSIGALGQAFSSFNSLTNIGSILTNEDLSLWEKFSQTITNIGFSLPMFISSVSRLGESLKGAGSLLLVIKSSLLGVVSAQNQVNLAQRMFTELTAEQKVAVAKNIGLTKVEATAISEENAQLAISNILKTGNAGATELLKDEELGAAAATGLLSAALDKLKMSMPGIGWIAGIAAGIAGVSFAIKKIIKVREEHIKKIKEEKDAIIERNNAEQDTVKNNIDAANSLKEIAKEYDKGNLSQREYNDKKAELIGNLDEEAQRAFIVAGSYEEATKALDNYIRKETERSKFEAEASQQAALYNMIQGAGGKGQGAWYTNKNLYENDLIIKKNDEIGRQLGAALQEAGLGSLERYKMTTNKLIFHLRLDLDDEDIVQKFKKYQEIINDFKWVDGNKIYDELASELKQMTSSEYYSQFLADASAIQADELTLTADDIGLSDATTKDAAEKYDEFIELIKQKQQEGIIDSSQTAYEIASGYIAQYGNSALKAASDFEILKNSVQNSVTPTEEFIEKQRALGADTTWMENRRTKADNAFDYIKNNNLVDQAKLLTLDDWETILASSDWETELQTALDERYADYMDNLKNGLSESIGGTSDDLKSIIDSGITNSLSATDENYTKILEKLDQIKEAYPELTNVINDFSTAGLIGSEHWIQTAYQLQSAIDKIEFDNLNAKVKEARQNLDDLFRKDGGVRIGDQWIIEPTIVPPDDSEFQEAIGEILNAEYEIDVEVHADAERDFTQLVSSLEQADSMADKIGEDFIVAADDIRELNQAFPGILQDIEYLGDGTIKLNEEIAKSAMAAAADEEAASTEALVTKLQNSANELRAKAETYDAMADIAHEAVLSESKGEEAKTEITAKLQELEVENDKIATQSELDNAALVANDSQDKGSINASNWTESYQEAANASSEFAVTAIENAKQVAIAMRGGDASAVWSDFGSNYTGQNTKASESTSAKGIKTKADGSADWKATEEQFRNMAEAARERANDIEGMIVAAAAKGTESIKKTGEAGKSTSDSGGGSEKEAEHEEYLEREADIYRTINEELDQIESTLSRIQTINDHEWGLDAQKTLEEEDKLLDQQLDKLKEKKKLQEQDLSSRRKQLEDVGVNFSDDGSAMLNAEGTLDSLYAHYNQMVDMYNAMSAAEQETYKTNLEAEKDRIDKIEKKISDYESTYSDYQSTLDSILDAHYAEIENEVKQFNNMIDVHLELNEAREEWNDFWYDVVQDVEDTDFVGQINKSIDALETLIGVSSGHIDSTVSVLTNHLLDTISEVQMQIASADNGGNLSIFGDDSALSKETLENYRDQLMKALTAAKQELDEISDNYLNMLDDAQDKIDKQVEAWEAIGAHLEHNAELIKLISGDKSYESLNTIYNQQYQNNLNLLTTQKSSMDYWKDMIDKYTKLLETTEEGSKEWKTYSEAYEKASNNYKEAVADLDKTVEDALNQLNEWKDSQLDAINDAFDRNLSGNLGLDQLEKEWNLINDSADRYLDNVERALGMEDLNKEFDDLLNNTNLTAQAQAELNKMRDEEIARLNEKNKLSQFDIDEVKARLEITKQQLALEDAQKNKSNLRLRRDSQGNYNYQYTGNEGDIEDASEGLMSAKREWYELVKNRNLDLAKAVIENRKNLQSELAALDDMYFENDDARRAKQLEIINKYAEKEKDIMSDAENAKQIFFDGTAKFFADVENNSVLPQWQTTVESLIDAWSNGGESSFTGAVEKGINDIEVTQDEFNSRTAEIMETAGVNYIDLKEKGIDPTKDSLDDLTDSNEDLSDALDDVNDKLKEQEKNLRNCEDAYNDLKDAAVNAVKEANQMLNQLAQTVIQTQQQIQAAINSAQSAVPITGNSSYTSNTGSSSNKGKSNVKSTTGKKNEYRLTYTDSEGGHSQSDTYTDKSNAKSAATSKLVHGSKHVTLLDLTTKKMVHGNYNQIDGKENKDELAKRIFESFRSGGYTGSWRGSNEANEMKSGKLALLHQKELVLNEDDTKNMLEAVNVLRSVSVDGIADSIINAARSSANILNGVGSGLMQTISNLVQNNSANTNNYRNMTVNADFSGVRSADAIYQALMELENYGMQEAYSNSPISRKAY